MECALRKQNRSIGNLSLQLKSRTLKKSWIRFLIFLPALVNCQFFPAMTAQSNASWKIVENSKSFALVLLKKVRRYDLVTKLSAFKDEKTICTFCVLCVRFL
jgi:hypothetical protein